MENLKVFGILFNYINKNVETAHKTPLKIKKLKKKKNNALKNK